MSVQVLLSTYNGERHLRSLLESLLAQDYADITILVRDDGSIDNAPALLREYPSSLKNVEVVHGEHLGFVQSFFTLLGLASRTSKYLALCDQDDVSQTDKVSRADRTLERLPSECAGAVLFTARSGGRKLKAAKVVRNAGEGIIVPERAGRKPRGRLHESPQSIGAPTTHAASLSVCQPRLVDLSSCVGLWGCRIRSRAQDFVPATRSQCFWNFLQRIRPLENQTPWISQRW
jgi:glycosyltransferase involved in cell wall biosynthesis